VKESYKLVASINKNALRPLIDEKKLLMSTLYSEALAYCIAHSSQHFDYSQLGPVVNVFENRDYKLFVSSWICERLGLKSKMENGGVKFVKSGNPINEKISFKVSLAEFAVNKFKARVPERVAPKPPASKVKKAPKRVDMLDSWARLPGSYGSGKR